MGRDITEQVLRVGHKSRLPRGALERTTGKHFRLIKPVQQQASAPERVIGPAVIRDVASRDLTLEESLALSEAAQRFVRLAKLRQYPGGAGNRSRQQEYQVVSAQHRYLVLKPCACNSPIAFNSLVCVRGEVSQRKRECVVDRLSEPDRLGFILCRFGE